MYVIENELVCVCVTSEEVTSVRSCQETPRPKKLFHLAAEMEALLEQGCG